MGKNKIIMQNINRLHVLSLIILSIVLSSCANEITNLDLSNFSQMPTIKELDYKQIQPNQTYDYWELRQAETGKALEILGSGGNKTKAQLSSSVKTTLDSTTTDTGFNIGCQGQGGFCFKYLVTVRDGQVQVLNNATTITNFLGTIDSLPEAALLASSHGYVWDGNSVATGSYIENGGVYTLIVLRLVNLCLPVQLDRFQISINKNADISVITSSGWESFANNCIQDTSNN